MFIGLNSLRSPLQIATRSRASISLKLLTNRPHRLQLEQVTIFLTVHSVPVSVLLLRCLFCDEVFFFLIDLRFLKDGRNFQVEYALKAVENAGTSIGIKCKDGVVFATEKIINSKLLVPGANKRLQTIDKHVGVVCR